MKAELHSLSPPKGAPLESEGSCFTSTLDYKISSLIKVVSLCHSTQSKQVLLIFP